MSSLFKRKTEHSSSRHYIVPDMLQNIRKKCRHRCFHHR